ncbi:MAG TPA: hypothetical protein VGK20_10770 [Candidatus Binatia bacterium]|jgi:hypothetical protein
MPDEERGHGGVPLRLLQSVESRSEGMPDQGCDALDVSLYHRSRQQGAGSAGTPASGRARAFAAREPDAGICLYAAAKLAIRHADSFAAIRSRLHVAQSSLFLDHLISGCLPLS